ncbi:MAG TPA: carboxypeptidase regulatory-like domain-containing protein [Candidatus Acidoferrum sp.]|nr:carboxypeptidase regulatory-like domain-containing protein [Candidatus Acidoferrum sp.]
MQTLRRVVVAAALCGSWLCATVRAEETYTLRGKVVSSVDGTPVRGALVQLSGPEQGSALSGNDGSFAFSKLAAGEFFVSARKQGYFATELGEPLGAVVERVRLDVATRELSLRLIPEGIIFGKIVDEQGEPIEGLEVQARPRFERNSGRNSGPDRTATTNEAGEYRISGLTAGAYYLLETVRTVKGYEAMLTTIRRVKSGVPIYFYPGVLEAAQAATIRVLPGSSQQLDWRIAHQPLYQVSGRVQTRGGGANLLVALLSSYSDQNFTLVSANPDGSFVLPAVAPGEYAVAAVEMTNEEAAKAQVAVKMITVKANMPNLLLQVFPVTRIPIRFREEYTHKSDTESSPDSAPANVEFLRVDLPVEVAARFTDQQSDWNAQKKELQVLLEPGVFRIQIQASPKIYVASAMNGHTDLLKEDLVVAPGSGAEPIELVLRDDPGSVSGTVRLDGKAAPGRVVLLPENAPRHAATFSADASGRFAFPDLAPGRYFLLALGNGTELDLQDPGTLRRIQSRGEAVELQADGRASVDLELKQWEE